MSVVTYNGITLPYAMSTSFSQAAEGDDLSDTDWYKTNFDITVICYINFNYLSQLAPGLNTNTTNPADLMDLIRSRLLARRKRLSYTINGVDLIPKPQEGITGSVDAANGPIPMSCTITNLTGETFLLQYRVTASYWENNQVNANQSPLVTNLPSKTAVLYHRWTETVEMDNCMMTTRTREGKYIIRSDNVQGLTADSLRPTVGFLQVPKGFLRTTSRYVQDPGGLAISYQLVDKEQFKMPPFPAYEASGTYTETVGPHKLNGVGVIQAVVRVRLKGAKTSSQDQLYNACCYIVMNKLILNSSKGNRPPAANVFNQAGQFQGVIKSFTITGGMYENTMEATCTALVNGSSARLGTVAAPSADYPFNYTPGTDGDGQGGATTNNPTYLPYGTANFLIQAAAYYDPNLSDPRLNDLGGIIGPGKIPGQAGAKPEV